MEKNQKNINSKNQNNLLEKKIDDLKFEILSQEIYT